MQRRTSCLFLEGKYLEFTSFRKAPKNCRKFSYYLWDGRLLIYCLFFRKERRKPQRFSSEACPGSSIVHQRRRLRFLVREKYLFAQSLRRRQTFPFFLERDTSGSWGETWQCRTITNSSIRVIRRNIYIIDFGSAAGPHAACLKFHSNISDSLLHPVCLYHI